MTALPTPPGLRVVTIPREAGDKPQEVTAAVSPRDREHVVISYHQADGDGSDHHPGIPVHVYVASSTDGGRTWTVANTSSADHRISIDSTVAFDREGNPLVMYLALENVSPSTRAGECFRRSLDRGRSWCIPVTVVASSEGDPTLDHMPNIAVDTNADGPHAGALYAVWDRQVFESGPQISLRHSEMVIARSSDNGATWSEPASFARAPTTCNHTASVAGDGTLYVMCATAKFAGKRDYWLDDVDYDIMVYASRDGGETFEGPYRVVSTESRSAPVAVFPRWGGWPVLALDPRSRGTLYVVWGDYRNGDRDVFVTVSDDNGRTWSKAIRVNDDPVGNGRDQAMQWLAVDPVNGDAYLIFYDRRADPDNVLATVTLARSTNGGRSWVNYGLSSRASDPRRAALGEYLGIAARDGRVYAAWIEDVDERAKDWKQDRRDALPGELIVDDEEYPFGPTALKVGVMDFK